MTDQFIISASTSTEDFLKSIKSFVKTIDFRTDHKTISEKAEVLNNILKDFVDEDKLQVLKYHLDFIIVDSIYEAIEIENHPRFSFWFDEVKKHYPNLK